MGNSACFRRRWVRLSKRRLHSRSTNRDKRSSKDNWVYWGLEICSRRPSRKAGKRNCSSLSINVCEIMRGSFPNSIPLHGYSRGWEGLQLEQEGSVFAGRPIPGSRLQISGTLEHLKRKHLNTNYGNT